MNAREIELRALVKNTLYFTERDCNIIIEEGKAWLRNTLERSGQDHYVMGLSGGIDSAVVGLWAIAAGVPIEFVLMPYDGQLLDKSNPSSLDDALLLLSQLPSDADYSHLVAPIGSTVDVLVRTVFGEGFTPNEANRMAAANAKARVRAVVLRTIANAECGLVLGTENRTENQFGYFTLGGDEQSDLEILSTLLKSQVRQIAEKLGVPSAIIHKAPSADLWAGHEDERELGMSYDEADLILSVLDTENAYGPYSIAENQLRALFSQEKIGTVQGRVRATQFKRDPKPTFCAAFAPQPA